MVFKGQFQSPLKLIEFFAFIIGLDFYGPASALLKLVDVLLLNLYCMIPYHNYVLDPYIPKILLVGVLSFHCTVSGT